MKKIAKMNLIIIFLICNSLYAGDDESRLQVSASSAYLQNQADKGNLNNSALVAFNLGEYYENEYKKTKNNKLLEAAIECYKQAAKKKSTPAYLALMALHFTHNPMYNNEELNNMLDGIYKKDKSSLLQNNFPTRWKILMRELKRQAPQRDTTNSISINDCYNKSTATSSQGTILPISTLLNPVQNNVNYVPASTSSCDALFHLELGKCALNANHQRKCRMNNLMP